jgi:hypothetical protein
MPVYFNRTCLYLDQTASSLYLLLSACSQAFFAINYVSVMSNARLILLLKWSQQR